MSIQVTLNSVNYNIPEEGSDSWGQELTLYLVALATAFLTRAGGSFTLTAELDFGPTHGVRVPYIRSQATTPATAGVVRLGNNQSVVWRTAAGSANKELKVNASDLLEFDGSTLATGGDLTAHINDTTDAHAASAITNTPAGNLAAANVQTALNELQTDVDTRATTAALTSHTGSASGAHAASAISNTPTGNLAATTVQAALNELQTDVDTRATSSALTTHTGAATGVHGVTGAVVGTSDVQALTFKDIDGGTASNSNRITVPKGSSGTLAALTRKQGTVLYDTSLLKILVDNGTTLDPVGSASGTGEISAVANPSMATDATGWTGATRVTTGSPLDPIVPTAISIANTAAAESSTSGGYYSVPSLAPVLRGWSLPVKFAFTTPATDVYRVSVYQGTTRLPLSTDVAGVTTLPAGTTGTFTGSVDTSTAAAYTINITRTSGTTGACLITNVIWGPGTTGPVASVGKWEYFTPNTTQGFGTISSSTLQIKQETDTAKVFGRFTTGTTVASQARLGLPSGLTFNVSADAVVGKWWINEGTGSIRKSGTLWVSNGENFVHFGNDDYTTAVSPAGNSNGTSVANSSTVVWVKFEAPIAEWAGAGLSTGPGVEPQYAYNSDVSSTATVTASGFASGSVGVAFSASWAVGTSYTRRVRFPTPKQVDEDVEICIVQNGQYITAASIGLSRNFQGAKTYGCNVTPVAGSSTDFDMAFNDGGYAASSATYAQNGSAWSALTALSWVARKFKPASVPFAKATATNSGLYKAGEAPGAINGAAIAAGMVGEMLGTASNGTGGSIYATTTTTAISNVTGTLVSITLNKGLYLVSGFSKMTAPSGAATNLTLLYRIGGTQVGNGWQQQSITASAETSITYPTIPMMISADGTVVDVRGVTTAGTAANETNNLFVVRIA